MLPIWRHREEVILLPRHRSAVKGWLGPSTPNLAVLRPRGSDTPELPHLPRCVSSEDFSLLPGSITWDPESVLIAHNLRKGEGQKVVTP